MGPTLTTRRLHLRPFTKYDADALHELNRDPEVLRTINGGVPPSMEQTVESILPRYIDANRSHPGCGFWAANDRGSGQSLGWFHLRPFKGDRRSLEIGTLLRRSAWGHGLPTEGSRALSDRAFVELYAASVVGTTLAMNVRSRRVLERLGMRVEAEIVYPADRLPKDWSEERGRGVKYVLRRDKAHKEGPRTPLAWGDRLDPHMPQIRP